jgi:hypothetical protein
MVGLLLRGAILEEERKAAWFPEAWVPLGAPYLAGDSSGDCVKNKGKLNKNF